MADITGGLAKLHKGMQTVDQPIDEGLDSALLPEYNAYVRQQSKRGKRIKSFAEWVNS